MPDRDQNPEQGGSSESREDAFLALVRANEARLRKICRVYAQSREAASDLYQDVLVELWRALPGFEGQAKKSTWLYRVALNTALDHERKRTVRREAALPDAHPLWDGGFTQPDHALEASDETARLYAALDRLASIDKALVLLYLDETSYADMAEVLGISESYVGVKLHRIKKTLAAWLAEESPA